MIRDIQDLIGYRVVNLQNLKILLTNKKLPLKKCEIMSKNEFYIYILEVFGDIFICKIKSPG